MAPVVTKPTLQSELSCTESLEIPNYVLKTFSPIRP